MKFNQGERKPVKYYKDICRYTTFPFTARRGGWKHLTQKPHTTPPSQHWKSFDFPQRSNLSKLTRNRGCNFSPLFFSPKSYLLRPGLGCKHLTFSCLAFFPLVPAVLQSRHCMAIMLISAPTTLEGKSDSIRVIFVAFLLGNCNAQNSPEHTKVHIKCLCSNRNHKSKLTHFKKQNCCCSTTNHRLTW